MFISIPYGVCVNTELKRLSVQSYGLFVNFIILRHSVILWTELLK